MELEHVNCTASANPTRRQIAALLTFASAVKANESTPARALMQSRDGIKLSKKLRTLYRAREQLASSREGEVATSYRKLPSFLEEFAAVNPGSVAFAEKNKNHTFKRAVVVPKAFAAATDA